MASPPDAAAHTSRLRCRARSTRSTLARADTDPRTRRCIQRLAHSERTSAKRIHLEPRIYMLSARFSSWPPVLRSLRTTNKVGAVALHVLTVSTRLVLRDVKHDAAVLGARNALEIAVHHGVRVERYILSGGCDGPHDGPAANAACA